jgi:hypothetical protein
MDADQAKQSVFTALDNLAAQLEADSSILTTFLQAMGRFHKYSFWNVILITLQKPEATRVAGFHTWRSLDRYVKKGERGIAILAPMLMKAKKGSNDDDQLVGFTRVYVWDVSQTDGQPLPQFATVAGNPGLALHRLHDFAEACRITVKKSDGLRTAQGISTGGTIILKPDLTAAEEFATLAHELGHELMHLADERTTLSKRILELEAEAVSFVVCSGVGLDTNTAFSDYIKLYGGNPKALRASLDRIQTTSTAILNAVLGEAA